MTREEIEKAIENGEAVWIIGKDIEGNKKVGTKKLNKYDEVLNNKLNGFWYLNKIFKTKAEAEHYLCHANITRTETLPFLTWEEFQKTGYFDFIGADKNNYCLDEEKMSDQIVLGKFVNNSKALYEWVKYWKGFNETNFYKAYDECVKAFKGEL